MSMPDATAAATDGADATLADLVTGRPALAPLFDRLGLDYCCGGQRRLGEAIDAAGLDRTAVLAELGAAIADLDEAASRGDGASADWSSMSTADLVEHLVATHHTYLRETLPRLDALADKVTSVHGDRIPELHRVRALFGELRADLEPHLMKEEQVLFPMIRELAAATSAPEFHCGTLRNPIRVMLMEHDRAGELLAELRTVTGGFVVPPDGCASFTAFYAGLAELEADTHLHVHKENNLLFPEVLVAEAELAGRSGPQGDAAEVTSDE